MFFKRMETRTVVLCLPFSSHRYLQCSSFFLCIQIPVCRRTGSSSVTPLPRPLKARRGSLPSLIPQLLLKIFFSFPIGFSSLILCAQAWLSSSIQYTRLFRSLGQWVNNSRYNQKFLCHCSLKIFFLLLLQSTRDPQLLVGSRSTTH